MVDRVYPIDCDVLAYGPATNVKKIRKVLKEVVEEENGKLSKDDEAKLFQEIDAAQVADEIEKVLIESVEKIAKPGPKQIGLKMHLPELNERIVNLEVQEIQVAKTCTCVITWDSKNTEMTHQIAWVRGDKIVTER